MYVCMYVCIGGYICDGTIAAMQCLRMATDRVWGGYPRVSGSTGSGLGMVFHPRFSGSGPRNQSGSVSGLVFHPWISDGYPK